MQKSYCLTELLFNPNSLQKRKATWDRGESYCERYYRNGSSPWSRETKMNCHAFVSINCMRADHSSVKARLSRFNIVFTAESEHGDGLQMEEHIFWDCILYEDQRATMMDILFESSKKEYPKSVTELLRLDEKRFVQGVCYFITKFLNLFEEKEKQVNVQIINSILLDLRDISKMAGRPL
jgi:hypothetical protein